MRACRFLLLSIFLGSCAGNPAEERPYMPPLEPSAPELPELVPAGPADQRLADILTLEDYRGPPLRPLAAPKVIASLDFDDPEEALPALWSAGETDLSLSRVPDGLGGHAVEIRGSSSAPAGIPIALWPLRQHAAYEIQYRIRTEAFRAGGGQKVKSATPVVQYLNRPGVADLESVWREALYATPGSSLPRAFRPTHDGRATNAWQSASVRIEPGGGVSHAALSIAYSSPASGQADDFKGQARGALLVDAVQVLEIDRDYARAHAQPGLHPRQVRVSSRGRGGMESTRDALQAPSGSTWSKRLTLGENAAFRTSVMADLNHAEHGREGLYRFSLHVDGEEAWRLDLNSLAEPMMRGWQEVEVDLSRFGAGERLVELRTEAIDGATASDALLWSDPRLVAAEANPGRTVVVVCIDTLGAHRLGFEGGRDGVSPVLDRLAAEGVAFRQAMSSAPWTLSATGALLTGYHPKDTGIGTYNPGNLSTHNPTPIPEQVETLAERLRGAGWDTEGALSNPFLHRRFRTDLGFRRFTDFSTTPDKGQAAIGVQLVLDWLDQPTGGDRYFYLHLLDPHTPYGPPKAELTRMRAPDYDGRWKDGVSSGDLHKVIMGRDKPTSAERQHLLDLHDAEILFTDRQVGRIVDRLRELPNPSLLVITSDHGEEFWEHEAMEHGHALYTEVLRVPFIFWGHGLTPGRSVEEVVSTGRMAATLLEWGGLPADPGSRSGLSMEPSLMPALSGGNEGLDLPVYAGHLLYGNERMTVIQGLEQYIYNLRSTRRKDGRAVPAASAAERYDLSEDPLQTRNLLGKGDPLALHRALLPAFLSTVKDRLVVVVDQGSSTDSIRIEIDAPGGLDRWAWDLVAPGPDGSQPDFRQDLDPAGGEASFQTRSRLAAFAVHPTHGPEGATLSVEIGGRQMDGIAFEVLDAPPSLEAAGSEPRVTAFYTPPPPWVNQRR
jgi:arylsulfatase A-like enzyme